MIVFGYTQVDHGITFKMVWDKLRFVCRRDGLNVDMESTRAWCRDGQDDTIFCCISSEGYNGKVMIDDALFCFFFSKKATQSQKEMKCASIESALTEAYAELGLDSEG